jgi:hypothetical protein
MEEPRILLEISSKGVTEIGVIAKTDEQSSAAHNLLGCVAAQLRSLSAALKVATLEQKEIAVTSKR